MLAVICRENASPRTYLLSIAGQPLLMRQLQWLRGSGFDRIAVEIGCGQEWAEVERVALEGILGWDVTIVRSQQPCAPLAVAAQAKFPEAAPILVLPPGVVGGGDLAQAILLAARGDAGSGPGTHFVLDVSPPAELGRLTGARLHLHGAGTGHGELDGWATTISGPREAVALSACILEKRGAPGTDVLVHAAEHAPGVWLARGAVVQKGARVLAPVLVGPGAVVQAGAVVGPRVFLGGRAVVSRGARLSDAIVEPDTIVGANLAWNEVVASPAGLRDFSGRRTQVDPLLLAARPQRPFAAFAAVSLLVMAVVLLQAF